MARAINHASKDYKVSSFDKARTTLLDECKRDVEKNLAPLQDTWYSQGISIVSDRGTNIRHQPLINKVAKTRFALHHLLLKRLASCREALATMVMLRAWKDCVKSGDENARAMGAKVAETIVDDKFWDEVKNLLATLLNDKRDIRDIMQNNKNASAYPRMEEIMVAIWEKMNIPLHCLGCALNPHFYDIGYQSPAPGGMPRRPPNMDKEVVKRVLEAFEKIGEN
ncbi:hypothetical protein Cgig2_026857 [Carnegiea gigantea]|uniref:Uncharacterized protein n=1 Tax=Carnegiea gigantea TaxID=171969 RepID=A0A9Q1QQ31_9CARY|nr:hypothetical protein Cgig2_026857 [Carnegiea gigantea]